ncbi:MAG: hypothetical protein K9G62_00790 [Alphaproteobacteria bacterium]|nr:hypothetical protein [Alphaproteobacteria bacterium]
MPKGNGLSHGFRVISLRPEDENEDFFGTAEGRLREGERLSHLSIRPDNEILSFENFLRAGEICMENCTEMEKQSFLGVWREEKTRSQIASEFDLEPHKVRTAHDAALRKIRSWHAWKLTGSFSGVENFFDLAETTKLFPDKSF